MHRPSAIPACERARAWVSQELDDELSQLERVALSAHLAACAACGEFAAGVRALTGELRAAPLLVPEPLVLPARRRAIRPVALGAAAAAVAAAVAVGGVVGSLTRAGGPQQLAASRASGGKAATQQPYQEQALLALLERLHPPTGRTVAV